MRFKDFAKATAPLTYVPDVVRTFKELRVRDRVQLTPEWGTSIVGTIVETREDNYSVLWAGHNLPLIHSRSQLQRYTP